MRVWVSGATGKLGPYVVDEARRRGWDVDCDRLELCDAAAVAAGLSRLRPDAVVHLAAMSTMADCYRSPERAWQVNVVGSVALATWCQQASVRLLQVSTDMVFAGTAAPYRETAPTDAVSVYGRSKAAADEAVLLACPAALVVRVALMCGWGRSTRRSFFDTTAERLKGGEVIEAFADEWRSTLYLADAATVLCDMATHPAAGVLHLGGPERLSRFDMCRHMTEALGVPLDRVKPVSQHDTPFDEPRPADLTLLSDRLADLLPTFRATRFADALRAPR